MKTHILIAGVIGGTAINFAPILGPPVATAQTKCTDQINYASDPRSNAEINGIGASTGVCPTPMTGMSNDVPGAVQGAVLGTPCSNYDTFIFGQSANGDWLACTSGGTATGQWVSSVPVIGTRPIGSSCTPGFDLAAQSPDGRGLICTDTGWVPGP